MSSTPQDRPNWFYAMLVLASLAFVATAIAYAIVPVLEQRATDAGQPPPPSEWRTALRGQGWWWLLVEAGVIGVLGLASMALDRWRQQRSDDAAARSRLTQSAGAE
jgi:uncharacterized membrane protein